MSAPTTTVAAAVVTCLAAVLSACASPERPDPRATEPVTPSSTPSSTGPAEPVLIGYDVRLEPGADGVLPVRVRWEKTLAAPEWMAVHDGVVYVADELFTAFRVSDGAQLWETGDPSGNGLPSDGGVEIGLLGTDRIRVWAPFNFDLVVHRETGALESLTGTRGTRPPMRRLRGPRPTRFRVKVSDPSTIVARWPDGRLAWRIVDPEPWYAAGPAIAVPGGLVLLTGSGHLVALDHR